MKKRLPKLTLSFESLRVLDGPGLAGGMAATNANTCPTSCQPTCGIPPATTNAAAAGFNTARACCV